METQVFVPDAPLVTPAEPSHATPPVTPAVSAPPVAEPFLKTAVSSYDTREAAIQGFDEAGKRIAELTPWASFSQKYEVQDPAELENIIAEYLELKRAASAPPAALPANAYESASDNEIIEAANAGDKQAESEWGTRYFRQQAEKLGFVRKDEVEQRFTDAQSADRQAREQYQETASMQEGASFLESALATAGITKENVDLIEAAHDSVENWIVRSSYNANGQPVPNSLRDRFFASPESRRKVVEEGTQRWLKSIQGFADRKSAVVAGQKTAAMAAAPKPLPNGNTPPPPPQNAKKNMSLDDPEFLRDLRAGFAS